MASPNVNLLVERLELACKRRETDICAVAMSIGMSGRRCLEVARDPLQALDIERLAYIAGRLDVSLDYLLGRTEIMDVAQTQAKPAIKAKARH